MAFATLNPFRKPTAQDIARADLEEAQRQLQAELSRAEYHTKMAEYHKSVVDRLSQYVKENPRPVQPYYPIN